MPKDDDSTTDTTDTTVMKRMGSAAMQGPENNEEEAFLLAPFNPSSDQIQHKALEMLNLGSDDVLFDLGCGDARFLCLAAAETPGLRCVGIEIDAQFVVRGLERVKDANLGGRIDIRWEDATKADEAAKTNANKHSVTDLTLLDDATALYLFILPKGIAKIMPLLESLKKKRLAEGKRFKLLTYMFKIRDWEATRTDITRKAGCPVYYYEF